MKKLFWLAVGIAAGMAASKRIQEDPKAAAIYKDLTKRVRELGDSLNEGFLERSTELNEAKKSATAPAKKPAAPRRAPVKRAPAAQPSSKPSTD
jgi:hypothetical protein